MNAIKEQFEKQKISVMQLDPFGVCNARCWFCPVKYRGNPEHGKETMNVELLEKILSNIAEERAKDDGLVSKSFNVFYTAHYNEILLYKHFEELLQLCQKYNLHFMLLSNGVPLTPDRVDLIKKYNGVVCGICLNVPAFERDTWSKRSGINPKLFDKLISNIKYATEQLPELVRGKSFSIQINGVNEHSLNENRGYLTRGQEFPSDMDLNPETGELATQYNIAKEMFPTLNIFKNPSLIDRAGLLDHVMTNKPSIVRKLQQGDESRKVIGCANGREVGGRPIGWIHVNARGEVFLCCNDYDMEVVFGDFKTQTLRDFWATEEHIAKIEQSYNTICKSCAAAIFEKP